jgi:S1-C subfamily serine protease
VARLTALLVRKLDGLDSRPDYVAFRQEAEPEQPEDRRAYTGTIPDYVAKVDGLRLSGVIEGGPAEKAGLAEGDVIVEFAGRTISNIYNYGDALDAVKVNQPVKVVFIRGEERHEVTLTPTGRP